MFDGATALSRRHIRRTTRGASDRPTAATLDILPRHTADLQRSDRGGHGQKPAGPLPDGIAAGRGRKSGAGQSFHSTAEPAATAARITAKPAAEDRRATPAF